VLDIFGPVWIGLNVLHDQGRVQPCRQWSMDAWTLIIYI